MTLVPTPLRRSALLALTLVPVVLLAGCALSPTALPGTTSESAAAQLTGHLHGGDYPVNGATVQLWSIGGTDSSASNYASASYGGNGANGSAAQLYATTTSNPDGSWAFSKSSSNIGATSPSTPVWGCPALGNPQIFVTAKGGRTQGSTNSPNAAAAFIIPLGPCQSLTSASGPFFMNEITTIATLAALQQYFDPATDTFSSPSSTQALAGLANAVANVSVLANLATGTVNSSITSSATPIGAPAAVTVTATPETDKIGTLANILSACVNTVTSSSSACSTLFNNAIPPTPAVTSQPSVTFPTTAPYATDTLQAAYFLLTNPTNGSASTLNTLFNLVPAQPVFQPTNVTAPTDWTVAINYASTGSCGSGANFLSSASHLAVDSTGNLWSISSASGGNLFELSPTGTPLLCQFGSTLGASTAAAIDPAGNLWVGGQNYNSLLKVTPSGSSSIYPLASAAGTGASFVDIDANGDIFAVPGNNGGGSSTSVLEEFVGGVSAGSPFTATVVSNTLGISPFFFASDTAGRLFLGDLGLNNSFFEVYPDANTNDPNYLNGYNTVSAASGSTSLQFGVGAGLAGQIYVANDDQPSNSLSDTLTVLAPGVTPGTVNTVFTTAQYAAGLSAPGDLALDGAGNVWVPSANPAGGNYVTGATSSGLFMLSEFSAVGSALSPTGSASSSTTVTGGFQKPAAVLPSTPFGIAVDPSGNVWVGSIDPSATSVTELVGAAVPVVTPISAALAAAGATTNAVSKP